MRFLITSARAPAPLDLADRLYRDGHQVILVDSMNFPLGRFCRSIDRYIRLPFPSEGQAYADALMESFSAVKADVLLPGYEEIFYIAKYVPEDWLKKYAIIPDIKLLFNMHSKYNFLKKLAGLGICLPKTDIITNREQIRYDFPSILKPESSRFGSEIVSNVTPETTAALSISKERPWVLQQKLEGRLLCTYSFAWHGQIVAHTNYIPRYMFNHAGGNYFIPFESTVLTEFTRKFIEKYQWHGHLAFDFIETGSGIYVIECNPRMTAGFHLIYDVLDCTQWPPVASRNISQRPIHYSHAVFLFFGWPYFKQKRLRQLMDDHHQAIDALHREGESIVPFYAPWLGFLEFYCRMLRYRVPFIKSAVMDIEWNRSHDVD